MGMFDDVKCDFPLPDTRVPGGSWFQTKSLYCGMDKFTITAAGRLIFHKSRYSSDDAQDIRRAVGVPAYKPVHEEDIDMAYHGDISMCASAPDEPMAEYVVRFTHGTVEWIRPSDTLSETHKSWLNAERQMP